MVVKLERFDMPEMCDENDDGSPPGVVPGPEAEEDDGLFAGGDEEEEESGDEAMEDVTASGAGDAATNGVKRKLVEEEDYD